MNTDEKETILAMALTRLSYFSSADITALYREAGSAAAVFDNAGDIGSIYPHASPRLIQSIKNSSEAIDRAKAEYEYDLRNGITPLAMHDSRYPARLRECPDAPVTLYYKGTADLNALRVVSIVGTRRCTVYGRDLIHRFITRLRQLCPDVLITSGLAYGVDICAHREALSAGYDTVGVLAHGLDTIYPNAHRADAGHMLSHGGLLTEYMTMTQPFAKNFIQRNRIIAGMADATILVESASHGGGLVTARIASDYHRDVFAFPGAVGAPYSEGCNKLIRSNAAALITSADDFAKDMGWADDAKIDEARKNGIERDMFPSLSDDEKTVVDALKKHNDLQLNMLTVQTGIAVGKLSSLLFSLEMKGIIKQYAGGTCHLM